MKKEGVISVNNSEGGRITKLIPVNVVNVSKNPLPEYQTEMSAGMDLRANLESPVYIHPKEIKLIPTGIKVQLPEGFEAQIRPRSGLAFKNGITVLNTPGTVDGDFTGEIGVILINHSDKSFKVENGDRIAQMIVSRCEQVTWNQVESLTETVRGEGGFGHTGKG